MLISKTDLVVDCAGPSTNPSPVACKIAVLNNQAIEIGHFESVHTDASPCIVASVAIKQCSVYDDLVVIRLVVEGNKEPPSIESSSIVDNDGVFYQHRVIVGSVERY